MESNDPLVKADAGNFFPTSEFENRSAAQAKPARDFIDRVKAVEVKGSGLTGRQRFASCVCHAHNLIQGTYESHEYQGDKFGQNCPLTFTNLSQHRGHRRAIPEVLHPRPG